TLRSQLACIEADFFQDVEYSSGEGNFIVQALRRLCGVCDGLNKRKRHGDDSLDKLKSVSQNLKSLTNERFGLNISGSVTDNDLDEDLDDVVDAIAYGEDNEMKQEDHTNILTRLKQHNSEQMMQEEDSDTDEDGPVVLDYGEVESSLARSSVGCTALRLGGKHKQAYPLLYAAMTEGEDEVMACARILDLRQDVSLVREAAAYLEQVEAHKSAFG
ncbi:hypothetical protein THAOC_17862, partial [Thalassiosira oceanica]